MGHPQAPLKMRNVRKSKVSNPNILPDNGKGTIPMEPLQDSGFRDQTNTLR
jgi:hypothetical protein